MARRAAHLSMALLLAAAVAGCGGQETGPSTVGSAPGPAPTESVGPPEASTGPAATATTATTTSLGHPADEPPGEPAPDFTLALGEGGQFDLSEASKPVYLVFWAEW